MSALPASSCKIYCAQCGYTHDAAWKGTKAEAEFIRVIDCTKKDSPNTEKSFYCSEACRINSKKSHKLHSHLIAHPKDVAKLYENAPAMLEWKERNKGAFEHKRFMDSPDTLLEDSEEDSEEQGATGFDFPTSPSNWSVE